MHFRDECEIKVAAGKGGDGAVSFHREKFILKGGPDGGDGGNGGDVVLVASSEVSSLLYVGRRPIYKAKNGQPGGARDRSGHSGETIEVLVPRGTQVLDAERGNLLRDLCDEGQRLVLAKGGRGGHGNARFATSVRQAPRVAQTGRDGEQRHAKLVLKLFAEVGLVGLPNAGKSTFLASITAATPKIADYPFTTLHPQVGICAVGDFETLCFADLPGLIEGAADGTGLGHQFLRHVERCQVLMHLVDVSPEANTPPLEAWRSIDAELERYSAELAGRERFCVASKCESPEAEAAADELEQALGRPVWRISAHTRRGVPDLLQAALQAVRGPAY